jgi:hypothetical protein
LKQENSKIRELQQENQELRQSLDEHQSALELIMSKYREQVSKLVKANNIERSLLQQSMDQSQVMCFALCTTVCPFKQNVAGESNIHE